MSPLFLSIFSISPSLSVLLTTEEVVAYLEANGAEKVNVIKLREPLLDITHMVFATCSSTRLIRQLGVTIAKNVSEVNNFTAFYNINSNS